MRKTLLLCGMLSAMMWGFGKRAHAADLHIGDPAPDFTAEASDGSLIKLSEWFNQAPIVLYFYPKDDTPGCTKEACGLRDNFSAFRNLKVTVFGVSYDSVESHKKFVEKYNLPYLLISDSHKTIARAYGADGLLVPKRMTFIIDKAGKIAYINPSVDPTQHSAELQEVLSKMQ